MSTPVPAQTWGIPELPGTPLYLCLLLVFAWWRWAWKSKCPCFNYAGFAPLSPLEPELLCPPLLSCMKWKVSGAALCFPRRDLPHGRKSVGLLLLLLPHAFHQGQVKTGQISRATWGNPAGPAPLLIPDWWQGGRAHSQVNANMGRNPILCL